MSEACSWCGIAVAEDDGFRVVQTGARRHAAFCRLEHVVPWAMQDPPPWEEGAGLEDGDDQAGLGVCALCGADLEDDHVLVVRHRGHHRIADAFCDVDHLSAWARRGGRFRAAGA